MIEALVATLIAVLAVIGLAHTFGLGHGLIDNYASSRAALAEAQRRMEWLSTLPLTSDTLTAGQFHPPSPAPFSIPGVVTGTYQWYVSDYDDPATPLVTKDLRQVTMYVVYQVGSQLDTLKLTRLILNP